MPWAKNGPRCQFCHSPVSRSITVATLKGKREKFELSVSNRPVRVKISTDSVFVKACRACAIEDSQNGCFQRSVSGIRSEVLLSEANKIIGKLKQYLGDDFSMTLMQAPQSFDSFEDFFCKVIKVIADSVLSYNGHQYRLELCLYADQGEVS